MDHTVDDDQTLDNGPDALHSRGLAHKSDQDAVLVVGAGEAGEIIIKELRNNPRWRLWPVACVDDDAAKHNSRIRGVPVLGDTASIPSVVRNEDISVVVIAMPSATDQFRWHVADLARSARARVLTLPALGSILRGVENVNSLKTVQTTDILGRPVVTPDRDSCLQFIRGSKVLITGASGSIGSELSYQIAQLEPQELVLLDVDETGLHDLNQRIQRETNFHDARTVITSVTDRRRVDRVMADARPDVVLHAAAYKHVPAMENQPDQAFETNVIGTRNVVRAAAENGVRRFVMVSTDKAVRPTSVMGASKRIAELVVASVGVETGLSVCSVRFGNVLGSRGSVIPTFEAQIRKGGPITITDKRMKRYFMTIPEAASLIIQAGAFGHNNVTYILDMGEEVPIEDLARRVAAAHGLEVGRDIKLVYTGIREGEKLHEELTLDFESAHETPHLKIRMIDGLADHISPDHIDQRIRTLLLTDQTDPEALKAAMFDVIRDIDGQSVESALTSN